VSEQGVGVSVLLNELTQPPGVEEYVAVEAVFASALTTPVNSQSMVV
jgi:hypothetical protein